MRSLVPAHLNIPFIAWPRLSRAPITFQGGLRDDSTGVHSFMFMLRRGAMVNDSTHTVIQLIQSCPISPRDFLSWCQFTCPVYFTSGRSTSQRGGVRDWAWIWWRDPPTRCHCLGQEVCCRPRHVPGPHIACISLQSSLCTVTIVFC